MIKIALFGVVVMMLALPFRSMKGEYSTYIGIAASIMVFAWMLEKLSGYVGVIHDIRNSILIEADYVSVLIKMAGLSFITEFSMDVCKDAGCATLAKQIGIAGKVTLMGVSMPVFLELVEQILKFG